RRAAPRGDHDRMTDPEPPSDAPRSVPRRRTRTIAIVVAVLLVVAAGVVVQRRVSDAAARPGAAEAVVARLAAACACEHFSGLACACPSDDGVTYAYYRITDGLGEFPDTTRPLRTVVVDDRAQTTMTVDWSLVGDIHWRTDT